jgi:hypothetical protein
VRAESFPVFLLKVTQSVPDIFDTPVTCILQRTAPEWGKTSSKNNASIKQVSISDYLFVQARHRFIKQWQHQAINHIVVYLAKLIRGGFRLN